MKTPILIVLCLAGASIGAVIGYFILYFINSVLTPINGTQTM